MLCDLCILGVLVLFTLNGYRKGFVKSIYSTISLFITVILVSVFKGSFIKVISQSSVATVIGEFFAGKTGSAEMAALCSEGIVYLFSIIILYIVIRLVLKFTLTIINSLALLPFIKSLNKGLGLILGAIIGVIWIVIILNVLHVIPQTTEYVQNSNIVEYFKLILI